MIRARNLWAGMILSQFVTESSVTEEISHTSDENSIREPSAGCFYRSLRDVFYRSNIFANDLGY